MGMHGTDSPELKRALKAHGLSSDKPSQLSDAFRCGWSARPSIDYTYIGKDGIPVLARDLEDERDRLKAELAEADRLLDVKTKWINDTINDLACMDQIKAALKPFADFHPSLLEYRHPRHLMPIKEAWPEFVPVMHRHYPSPGGDSVTRVEIRAADFKAAAEAIS